MALFELQQAGILKFIVSQVSLLMELNQFLADVSTCPLGHQSGTAFLPPTILRNLDTTLSSLQVVWYLSVYFYF